MYSELFKTVFVHIPRTGGQSVENLFVAMHELTWKQRGELLLGRNPKQGENPKYLAHLFAREYLEKGHLEEMTFSSAFKFSIVRNPYDRVLSEYRYRARKRPLAFTKFLRVLARQAHDRHIVPASDYVLDASGNIMVDVILRFESLTKGFANLSTRIFGSCLKLPHLNGTRQDAGPQSLDCEARTLIYRLYERDFDIFRYPSERIAYSCSTVPKQTRIN